MHATPTVHSVPGGFVVVTPAPDNQYVIEAFVHSINDQGQTVSSPLTYWIAPANEADDEVASATSEIERSLQPITVTTL